MINNRVKQVLFFRFTSFCWSFKFRILLLWFVARTTATGRALRPVNYKRASVFLVWTALVNSSKRGKQEKNWNFQSRVSGSFIQRLLKESRTKRNSKKLETKREKQAKTKDLNDQCNFCVRAKRLNKSDGLVV